MSSRPRLFAGVDVGTSSTKVAIFDSDLREISTGSAPHVVRSPQVGWAESDPYDWWGSVRRAVQMALKQGLAAGHEGRDIAAVGLSGQMHGLVICDEDATPSRPAMLWADERAEPAFDRYRELGVATTECLGNPLVAGMTGPLLCWLRDSEPKIYEDASFALQCKDWLRLKLTGEVGAEHSDASGTLLYDLGGQRWATEVIDGLGLRRSLFACLGRSPESAGELTGVAADFLGLSPGVIVAYGSGDTAAALLGSGLTEPGEVELTVGTAAQVATPRDQPLPDPSRRYHVFAAATGGYYALAAVQAAGLAFEWAWRSLGCDWQSAYGALVQSPPGANGVSFLPHVAGARSPWMDPRASGAFLGLRLNSERVDLIRSVFEGVAFSIYEAARSLPEFATTGEIRLAGGGSRDPAWRQLLADILDRPLRVIDIANVSARGAAILGGLAGGLSIDTHRGSQPRAEQVVVHPRSSETVQLSVAYQRWIDWGGGNVTRDSLKARAQ